jgi:phospholipid/cholesterol/gamma-HCH transport system substrate-binding protein
MRESLVETLVGAAVVLVAVLFLVFGLSQSGEASSGGKRYEVTARFNNVAGIERGSDVLLAGLKKGVVRSLSYDGERGEAVLRLALDADVQLPDDSDARIVSGLFGGATIALEPGGSMDLIAADGTGEIQYTRGAVDLLTLFASVAQGSDNGGDEDYGGDADGFDLSEPTPLDPPVEDNPAGSEGVE